MPENCKTSHLYDISNVFHGIILAIGLVGEVTVLFFIAKGSRRTVVRPLLLTIYVGGGFYLIGHCAMSFVSTVIEGPRQTELWLKWKEAIEETTGTIVLWAVTSLAMARVLAVSKGFTIKESKLVRLAKCIAVVLIIVYTIKELTMIVIRDRCDCEKLVTRVMLYAFRLIPAIVMIIANLYLAYTLYEHVKQRGDVIPRAQLMRNNTVTKVAIGTAMTMVVFCFPITVVYTMILRGKLDEPCVMNLERNTEVDKLYEIVCLIYDVNYIADVVVYGLATMGIRRRFRNIVNRIQHHEAEVEMGRILNQ